jgi:hypothetical protein
MENPKESHILEIPNNFFLPDGTSKRITTSKVRCRLVRILKNFLMMMLAFFKRKPSSIKIVIKFGILGKH